MRRKWLAILLAILVGLSLTACNGTHDDAALEDQTASPEPTPSAQAEQEDTQDYAALDVLYEVQSDGTAAVVGFAGEGNQATIDSSYEGHEVVSIADSAFEDCTMLESVIMWADIQTVGDSAFKGCTGLTEISISSEAKGIGAHAFEGCTQLETLILWGSPNIGDYAFAHCTSLTEISIGSDTEYVGNHAFEGCTGATSLIIWGVDIIGDYAFAGCTGIEEVSIPSEVLSVGNHAFDGCTALASVILWDDETAIGSDAFANCPNLSDAPAARGQVLECPSSDPADDDQSEPSASHQHDAPEGLRPEFKQAMDSYEAFYDEYCDFMVKYKENPTDLKLAAEYSDMLVELSEMEEAFDAWKDEDLTNEELAYYLEVTERISQKLLEIA